MYKVVLVDDETWILLGLKKAFQWEDFGFTVIADTDNPRDALDIILAHKPDLVITDIRMPEVSGLDIMRKVRENGIEAEFIVLSGFDEFSYAQEAMKLGAFDYWLKPFKIDEGQKSLTRLAEQLDKKKLAGDILLFDMLINNNEVWFDELGKRGLQAIEANYQAAVLINHEGRFSLEHFEMPGGKSFACISLGLNKELYVINTDTDIFPFLKLAEGMNNTIGMSAVSRNPKDIQLLFKQADIAAQSAYILKKTGVYKYNSRDTEYINRIIELIIIEVENKNYKEASNQLDKVLHAYSVMLLSLEDIVFLWNRLAAYFLGKYGNCSFVDDIGFVEYDEIFGKFGSLEVVINGMKDMIASLGTDLGTKNEYSNENFNKLLEDVEQNYTKKLVLKELCDKYYININYCCELFKKVEKMTFSDYVTGLRMKKTVELMKSTALSIEDITYESGYNDYYYFNRVFSKYYGISPARYKKNIGERK